MRRVTLLRRLLVPLALLGLLSLGVAGPAGATTCRFSGGVAHARVDGGTGLRMFVMPDNGRL